MAKDSASSKLRKIFDEKGQDVAKKAVERLGLQPHTARSLFSRWNNPPDKATKKAKSKKASAPKKSGKKSAKKAAPKKSAAKKVSRERLPASESATA